MAEYYPKLEEAVKKKTGARGAYAYLHNTRSESTKDANAAYSGFCHSDAGPDSPPIWRRMLRDRFKVPEQELAAVDLCLVNVWFPRDRPAFKNPLCLLDGSTVDLKEHTRPIHYLIPPGFPFTTKLLRTFEGVADLGEGDWREKSPGAVIPKSCLTGPSYAPGHRWVFCSDQRPDEAWVFRQYDEREGVTKCCFHNSFSDPFHVQNPDTPGRRSVEFRLVLSFPKKESIREEALQAQQGTGSSGSSKL